MGCMATTNNIQLSTDSLIKKTHSHTRTISGSTALLACGCQLPTASNMLIELLHSSSAC